MKEDKLYLFYIRGPFFNDRLMDVIIGENDVPDDEITTNTPLLYAYTTSKKYAKEFREIRNKARFIETVQDLSNVSDSELSSFKSLHRFAELMSANLATRSTTGDGSYPECFIDIPMVITYNEMMYISAEVEAFDDVCLDLDERLPLLDMVLSCFKKSEYDIWLRAGFPLFLGALHAQVEGNNPVPMMVDEVLLFLNEFGETFGGVK